MTKYNINYNQTGGRLMVTKLRPSVCEQASNIINYLLGSLFIQQNGSMWYGTDFYHLFGNEVAVLNMNLYQFEYMISSIEHMHRDASYSAKIHMIKYILVNTNLDIISLDRLDYSGNLNRLDNILSEVSHKEKSRVKVVFHDLKSEINT